MICVIVISWLDGRHAAYKCQDYRVDKGQLSLFPLPGEPEKVTIVPLENVRTWTVEK